MQSDRDRYEQLIQANVDREDRKAEIREADRKEEMRHQMEDRKEAMRYQMDDRKDERRLLEVSINNLGRNAV